MTDPETPETPTPAAAPTTAAAPPAPAPPAPTPVAGASKTNGLGVAALVLGIVAFIGAFIPFLNYVTGVVAVVGLVLGIVALVQKRAGKPLAITGTALSFVALILSIVLAIVYSGAILLAANSVAHEDDPQGQSVATPKANAPAEIGTRAHPAPIGSTVGLKSGGQVNWEVTLGTPTLDANAAVAATNEFNAAPPAGDQYAMVPVTVVYKGSASATPFVDITIDFVAADGTTHTWTDAIVVTPAPEFEGINALYTGAKATGNVVIAVPTADITKGTWAVSETFGSSPYFFAAQ